MQARPRCKLFLNFIPTDPYDKQEGKLEDLERKQNVTNSGLWYLCQAAEGVRGRISEKLFPVSSFPRHYHFKLKANPSPSEVDFVSLIFGRKLRQRRLQQLNTKRIPSRYENAAQILRDNLYLFPDSIRNAQCLYRDCSSLLILKTPL